VRVNAPKHATATVAGNDSGGPAAAATAGGTAALSKPLLAAVSQLEQQQTAPAEQRQLHPIRQQGERVQLVYSNERWQLLVVPCSPSSSRSSSTAAAPGSTKQPLQQPLDLQKQQQQQQQQQGSDRLAPLEKALPVGQTTPLRHPKQQPPQQQHISWSPAIAAAAVGASPSHPAVVRARQARHSRNSSGCSEAALQLEQQLLGVFSTGSLSAGRPAASTAAAVEGTGAVEGASGFGSLESAQQQWLAGWGSSSSPAVPRTPQQQQQQSQQQEQEWGGAGEGNAAADSGFRGIDGSSWQGEQGVVAQQAPQRAVSSGLPADTEAAAAAIGWTEQNVGAVDPKNNRSAAPCSSSSPATQQRGRLIMQFSFWVQDLNPCDPLELKTLPPGTQTPADTKQQQHPNKLLLQLTEGLFTLPPQPQLMQHPTEGVSLLSPTASGDEWVGAEGFDSMLRFGLGARQMSGQMAAVAQQQQLYRCGGGGVRVVMWSL
jgi:hypothetical protein